MNHTALRHYTKMVAFLGQALGPDYEITLHDITGKTCSVAANANRTINERTLDAPPSNSALKIITDKAQAETDYRISYNDITNDNKVLRSSTLHIKDSSGNLTGLMCINFDDSRFQSLSTALFQLCHPDEFVDRNIVVHEELLSEGAAESERFAASVTDAANSVLQEVISQDGVPVDRLTQAEKIHIVNVLNLRGVFNLRGAVTQVAKALFSSPASIYRYLGRIQKP